MASVVRNGLRGAPPTASSDEESVPYPYPCPKIGGATPLVATPGGSIQIADTAKSTSALRGVPYAQDPQVRYSHHERPGARLGG